MYYNNPRAQSEIYAIMESLMEYDLTNQYSTRYPDLYQSVEMTKQMDNTGGITIILKEKNDEYYKEYKTNKVKKKDDKISIFTIRKNSPSTYCLTYQKKKDIYTAIGTIDDCILAYSPKMIQHYFTHIL